MHLPYLVKLDGTTPSCIFVWYLCIFLCFLLIPVADILMFFSVWQFTLFNNTLLGTFFYSTIITLVLVFFILQFVDRWEAACLKKYIWIASPTLFYELCHLYIYIEFIFCKIYYFVSLFSLLRCFFETKLQFQCYN